jgi:hypothetical protein
MTQPTLIITRIAGKLRVRHDEGAPLIAGRRALPGVLVPMGPGKHKHQW